MADDINSLRGFNPGSSGGGTFLKLADGDAVKLRLFSLPVIFTNTFTKPDGEVNVDTRFAFVVWNHDVDKAQIWITNGATYGQQIAPLLEDEEYGDWRKYNVTVSRTGQKAQTRYYVRPGAKQYELDAKQIEACENLDIIGMIGRGQGASSVMWLTEYRDMMEKNKGRDDAQDRDEDDRDDVVVQPTDEQLGEEEPIDLSEIPF